MCPAAGRGDAPAGSSVKGCRTVLRRFARALVHHRHLRSRGRVPSFPWETSVRQEVSAPPSCVHASPSTVSISTTACHPLAGHLQAAQPAFRQGSEGLRAVRPRGRLLHPQRGSCRSVCRLQPGAAPRPTEPRAQCPGSSESLPSFLDERSSPGERCTLSPSVPFRVAPRPWDTPKPPPQLPAGYGLNCVPPQIHMLTPVWLYLEMEGQAGGR